MMNRLLHSMLVVLAQIVITLVYFTYMGAPLYTWRFYEAIVYGSIMLWGIGYCLQRARRS